MKKMTLAMLTLVIAAPAFADEALTGVKECDEYITKYEACLTSKVPAASLAQMKTSFDQFKQQMITMSKNEGTKVHMPMLCTQQLNVAKQATGPLGCTY